MESLSTDECTPYKTATVVLSILLIIFVVIFAILAGVKYIHFGDQTVPPLQPECKYYAGNDCEGSRTPSGQLCVLQNGRCVEYELPGPPSVPQLPNDEMGAWFLANPNLPVTFSIPPGTTAITNPYTYSYSITYNGIDQRGIPTLTTLARRRSPDSTTPDIQVRNIVGFTPTLAYTQVLPTRQDPGIAQVAVTTGSRANVKIYTSQPGPFVAVSDNLGVIQRDRAGREQSIPPLPPPILPSVTLIS